MKIFYINEDLAKKWIQTQNYDLFLSIEMTYPSYEIMKLVDKKKLLLWVQDPRPDSIWQEKRNSVSAIKDPCVTDKNIPLLVKKLSYENRVKFISQGYSLNNRAIELYDLPEKYPIRYLPNPIDLDMNYEFDLSKKKKTKKPAKNKKDKEQDLVQKYIINPKKDDAKYNKKEKEAMDSGTFKLLLLLVLVLGFTIGVGY